MPKRSLISYEPGKHHRVVGRWNPGSVGDGPARLMIRTSDSGGTRTTIILVQVAIVVGVIIWFKVGLPRIEKSRATTAAAERSKRLEDFIQTILVDDTSRRAPDGASREYPHKLRDTPSLDEVESTLGAPKSRSTDFAGGEHLTWTGGLREVQASFNKGRLYSLRLEDRTTGHGEMVFESGVHWSSF